MNKTIKTITVTTFTLGTLLAGFSQLSQVDASTTVQTQQGSTQQQNHQKLLKQTKQLAAEGKVINSESFGLGSSHDAIVKKWGKPDEGSDRDNLFYDKRHISFFGEAGHTKEIYSNDLSYDGVTYKEVKKEFGKPVKEVEGEDGIYLTYPAGKHTLEIAFYYNDLGSAADTIKSVSVY
ncbi:DUF4309 domain-containing protein [Shimazuella kribbensis]|uniref:DUF4309 domain-containing protein n=1 Tax=Shimazuella kribbensis TaxID=139808 RepID=UPI00040D2B66|nr:DUF4309 domain-containing protein [Shimazuella kribbensis]